LVAAADGTGEFSTVLRAAARLDVGAEALDSAEAARLATLRDAGLELWHPLVRSAVYQGAPLSKRHAVHRALASVLEGDAEADRRAWHRAAASVGPDPAVVEELEQAAVRARRRSGFVPPPRAHGPGGSAPAGARPPPKTPGSAGGSSAHGCCWSGRALSLRSRCNVR